MKIPKLFVYYKILSHRFTYLNRVRSCGLNHVIQDWMSCNANTSAK